MRGLTYVASLNRATLFKYVYQHNIQNILQMPLQNINLRINEKIQRKISIQLKNMYVCLNSVFKKGTDLIVEFKTRSNTAPNVNRNKFPSNLNLKNFGSNFDI